MSETSLYRVIFHQQGKVYEIYARGVSHNNMVGFVEIEDIVFGSRSQVVMDPTEESLRTEFEGVRRFFVPIHSVVRIDQVEKEGQAKISKGSSEPGLVMPFPFPLGKPPGTPSGSN